MSTGRTLRRTQPASTSSAALGASVVGLQETYTMRLGAQSMIRCTTFFDRPARGGSTTSTSGRPARVSSSGSARRASPAKNLALVMPLARAPSASAALAALARPDGLDGRRTAAIPSREALGATPAQGDLAGEVAALGGEQAVVHRRHAIAAGGCVKAAQQLAGRAIAVADGLAEGVLELVAVAPRLHGGNDLLQLVAVEVADALERLVDLLALDLQLALVRQHLPRHAGVVGDGSDALGARLEHLQRASVRVASLALVHYGAHEVAGDRAGDEHHIATVAETRDALAAEGERLDAQLQLVATLWARRW